MQNKEGDSPLVTAIITTHNRLPLLPRAIDSVLAQTYTNIECIVVSDASNDGTEEYCYTRNDIKFIAVSKADSKGGNHARNLGIEASQGVYVAFLDDDDYWLPTKIEKQVCLIEVKKCGLVYNGLRNEVITDSGVEYIDTHINTAHQCDCSRDIMFNIMTVTSCILVNRSLLIDVGCFDKNLRFWQEYELTIRLAQYTHFYFLSECLTVYRIDTNDQARLTNKYYSWAESVNYIYSKHKNLYNKLSDVEFLRYLLLVWNDALGRLKNANMIEKQTYYLTLILECTTFLDEGLKNRKPWHCFPLLWGILWYVKKRHLVIESRFLAFLLWCRHLIKK